MSKGDDKLVGESPQLNEHEDWEPDLQKGVTPGGLKLPQFRHLDVLKITTIPEDVKSLENVTRLWLHNADLEGFPLAVIASATTPSYIA